MALLSYQTLEGQKNPPYVLKEAPEKILQFGEGNFLRGFVDYFFDILNEKGLFHGKCVVIQPLEQGQGEQLNRQEGLYTLYLRSMENGQLITKKRVVSVISRVINPYHEKQAFLDCAKNPELRVIVSNTTEAGIAFRESDQMGDMNGTFPAKLTAFLWERYQNFGEEPGKGFLILSCELIDNNGAVLREYVERYAGLWGLPEAFVRWIAAENVFCSTLVDRIITGYPHGEAPGMNEANSYEDRLIDTGEPFAFWAIEGPEEMKEELLFEEAGLPVVIVPSQSGFKKRKVRILNGSQTASTLAAYLAGIELERDYMNDPLFAAYTRGLMFDEILPATDLDPEDMKRFANSCLERLRNPFIAHRLIDISLNSVPKWRARILPTLKDYAQKYRTLPKRLTFSLASLLAFYRCEERDGHFYGCRDGVEYEVRDDLDTLRFFAAHSQKPAAEYVHAYVEARQFHGTDFSAIPGFEAQVTKYLEGIQKDGVRKTLEAMMAT